MPRSRPPAHESARSLAPPRGASEWDIMVVGGGVHGAAIARDAALRGLSVLLVEKTDFASGTSSRSSKLAHGGLRYLEHFELDLVRESLHERDAILRIAPHLSWPLPFLIPLSGPKPRAGWKVRVGLSLYDFLAGSHSLGRHEVISEDDAVALAPALEGCGMRSAARYHDAGMDDARIVVEMMLDARARGATCLNHARVRRLLREKDRVVGAVVEPLGAPVQSVHARLTVLACGPWTDGLAPARASKRLQLTKGAHVFVRRPLVKGAALMLAAPQDGRIFFVIPWKEGSLVGTTDTAWTASADRVRVSTADVRYLIAAVNDTLPAAQIAEGEIVAAQAGLRPLVAPEDGASPSSISRDYMLDVGEDGLVVVEGGKYTIFRRLAERVVDLAADLARSADPERVIDPCATATRTLPGAVAEWPEWRDREVRALARRLPRESAERLVDRYGVRAREVLAPARGDTELLHPACDDHPHLLVEAVHAMREELAVTVGDALLRRLDLAWWDCGGRRCRPAWAGAFARVMEEDAIEPGLDDHERELHRDWRS